MFKDLFLNIISAVNYIWVQNISFIHLTISLHSRVIYTRKNKTLTLRVNGKKRSFWFDKRQILHACKVQFLTHIKCYLCKTSLTVYVAYITAMIFLQIHVIIFFSAVHIKSIWFSYIHNFSIVLCCHCHTIKNKNWNHSKQNRAQNNGQLMDNVQPDRGLDRSNSLLAGHFWMRTFYNIFHTVDT